MLPKSIPVLVGSGPVKFPQLCTTLGDLTCAGDCRPLLPYKAPPRVWHTQHGMLWTHMLPQPSFAPPQIPHSHSVPLPGSAHVLSTPPPAASAASSFCVTHVGAGGSTTRSTAGGLSLWCNGHPCVADSAATASISLSAAMTALGASGGRSRADATNTAANAVTPKSASKQQQQQQQRGAVALPTMQELMASGRLHFPTPLQVCCCWLTY